MKVLVFDTETTGLPQNMKNIPKPDNLTEWPHIVQISYIIYDTDNAQVVTITDHIVQVPEGVNISEQNAAIHGITNEISQQGIPIKMAIDEFMNDVDSVDMIVAHNTEFDRKMLLTELYRIKSSCTSISEQTKYDNNLNKIKTSTKFACTMQESINLCNIKAYTKIDKKEYLKWPTLSELCQHLFNYEPKNLHNSLNDVAICLRCFYQMRFKRDICDENDTILQMINKLK